MAGMGGIIILIGMVGFVSIAFLAKYINPSLRLYRLTICTYMGIMFVTVLASMTILYPKVYGLEVEVRKQHDIEPLYEFVHVSNIPEDYLVETFDIADPKEQLDIQIADDASMWMTTPEFFIEKEPGRDVITIKHYASPYIYNGIIVADDTATLRFTEDTIEYDVGAPLKIKRSFNRMVHDEITKQFFGTVEIFSDWGEYFEAENYFHIITPENVDITHEQDIFYIEYMNDEE